MASSSFNLGVKYKDYDVPVATTTSGLENINVSQANVVLGAIFLYNTDYYYDTQCLYLSINGKQVVLRRTQSQTVARTYKVRVFYI